MTTPELQSKAEPADVSSLQAILDEVAAFYGHKPRKIIVLKGPVAGTRCIETSRTVFLSERLLLTLDLGSVRFQAAKHNALSQALVLSPFTRPFFACFLAIPLFFIGMSLATEPSTPRYVIWMVAVIFVGWPFLLEWLRKRDSRWRDQYFKSESFMRRLLEITGDVDRTRGFLASKKAKPEELAKLDALVREMGLESPEPAKG